MAEDSIKKVPSTTAVNKSWIVLEEMSQRNSRWVHFNNMLIGILLFISIIVWIILVGQVFKIRFLPTSFFLSCLLYFLFICLVALFSCLYEVVQLCVWEKEKENRGIKEVCREINKKGMYHFVVQLFCIVLIDQKILPKEEISSDNQIVSLAQESN